MSLLCYTVLVGPYGLNRLLTERRLISSLHLCVSLWAVLRVFIAPWKFPTIGIWYLLRVCVFKLVMSVHMAIFFSVTVPCLMGW